MQWYDYVGFVGVGLIVGTYLLLQLDRIDSKGLLYSVANGLGAGLVLLSLCFEFNASAAVVEGFWLVLSIVGIVNWSRRRRAAG